jgi:RES domain-containing protein
MRDLVSIIDRLHCAPVNAMDGKLVRLVPFQALTHQPSIEWLYTSGKPNRYNPRGLQCLYFSEDEETALAEHRFAWGGRPDGDQPYVTFRARVHLTRVLDLTSPPTLKILKMAQKELFAPWRNAKTPTTTQMLGQAASKTGRFSAIRYPSVATRQAGSSGCNVVLFVGSIRIPESVTVLGHTDAPLQKLP